MTQAQRDRRLGCWITICAAVVGVMFWLWIVTLIL
jgi:hypothetical protein